MLPKRSEGKTVRVVCFYIHVMQGASALLYVMQNMIVLNCVENGKNYFLFLVKVKGGQRVLNQQCVVIILIIYQV